MAPLLCRNEATRTPDPYVPNVVRYQLRYIPILAKLRCKGTPFFDDMHFFALKNLPELKKCVSLHPHLRQMFMVS